MIEPENKMLEDEWREIKRDIARRFAENTDAEIKGILNAGQPEEKPITKDDLVKLVDLMGTARGRLHDPGL